MGLGCYATLIVLIAQNLHKFQLRLRFYFFSKNSTFGNSFNYLQCRVFYNCKEIDFQRIFNLFRWLCSLFDLIIKLTPKYGRIYSFSVFINCKVQVRTCAHASASYCSNFCSSIYVAIF